MISAETDPYVRVRAAAEHNLRDVDVDVPRNAIVVFTGVSGSGKSSLAFDTIYAEAQRRYFESVAPYARRLLQQIDTPQVQEITGLPPAVALRQQRGGVSSRSTVGTITTLSNLLRMLFSRAGAYPDGAPRLAADAFSPNTVAGACPACDGLGVVHDVAEDLLVPDVSLTIREGAIAAWPGAWQGHNLRRVTKNLGIDVDTPWRELTREHRTWLLFTDERPSVLIRPRDKDGGGGRDYMGTFRSARSHVQQVLAKSGSQKARDQMLAFMRSSPCLTCGGAGLRPEALAVTFGRRSIAELGALTLAELAEHLRPGSAGDDVASRLSLDLVTRLDVLLRLGVGYLSLRRSSTTLSSGEAQRLRIATQLRAGLFGVAYVLDEPSAGLHPAETEPLLDVLEQLKAGGNSVFVVEHNLDVIRRADWIVEVGPGAGADGGRIVYSGPLAGLEAITESPTSRHLFGRAPRLERPSRTPSGWLEMSGVAVHNLQHVAARLPIGGLTAITGVSGAGKSTLLIDVLGEGVRRHLGQPPTETEGALGDLVGLKTFDRLVVVDQRPIGRTPRSNVATYVGLFDTVRKLFAETPEARRRDYGAGRFSSNVAGGRCEVCRGEGVQNVELLFLPGVSTPCSACHGARYNDETLEVTLRGQTIADVLAMSVDDALEVFEDIPTIARRLRALHDVRLGYLRLGQTAMEVSGGEAQRIKLASELQRAHRGHGLYLLDEPTTGLHASDAAVLMRQLHELADAGNTVVVVEHDLDVVASADWVIDLGPGGGDAGGQVVAAGTPSEVARDGVGATAAHLRNTMADH